MSMYRGYEIYVKQITQEGKLAYNSFCPTLGAFGNTHSTRYAAIEAVKQDIDNYIKEKAEKEVDSAKNAHTENEDRIEIFRYVHENTGLTVKVFYYGNVNPSEKYFAICEEGPYLSTSGNSSHIVMSDIEDILDSFSKSKIKEKISDTACSINSPAHYTSGDIETIDYIQDVLGVEGTIAFCRGNVTKYIGSRLFNKNNALEDARKAKWYLHRMIQLLERIELNR